VSQFHDTALANCFSRPATRSKTRRVTSPPLHVGCARRDAGPREHDAEVGWASDRKSICTEVLGRENRTRPHAPTAWFGNRELSHDTPYSAGFFKVRLRHGPALSTEGAAPHYLRRLAECRARYFDLIVSRIGQFHNPVWRIYFRAVQLAQNRSLPPVDSRNRQVLRARRRRADAKMTQK
jgi:hypothetical protein